MGDASYKTGLIFEEHDLQNNDVHNIAITNIVLYTCEIRFHDVIGQSTVHMYSYA